VLRPAPIRDALRYPTTAGTLILSLAATIAWWAHVDCSALLADAHIGGGQLHRLVTASLLHRDPIHLAFNFFWVWTFGALIERHLGGPRTLVLFVTLAAVGTAAEHIFLTAGVGLSGIVFGLFGFLWFASRQDDDDRFAGAIDRRTKICFATWFALCIGLTLTNIYPIANLTHATAALLGGAIAWATTRYQASHKQLIVCAAAILLLLCAGLLARPHVNLSRHRGQQEASLAYEALRDHHDVAAVRWLRDATTMSPRVASWWFNRGIAEARLRRHDDALLSYNNACRLEPANRDYRVARDSLQDYLAGSTRQASVSD